MQHSGTKITKIPSLLQTFRMATPETVITRSVTLIYVRFFDVSLLDHSGEPLGRPQRTDVLTPNCAFIEEWSREHHFVNGLTTTASPIAQLFVFENAPAAMKLEVFVWRVEQVDEDALASLHYAFLLQVVGI